MDRVKDALYVCLYPCNDFLSLVKVGIAAVLVSSRPHYASEVEQLHVSKLFAHACGNLQVKVAANGKSAG